jgi:hypothetical protein
MPKSKTKKTIKPLFWGATGGAILTIIIGFAWGGWVTGGTARTMAEEKADAAVIDRLTPICVARFNQDPEKDQKLKELKETSSYQRGEYIEKQGWAKIPGEEKPDSKVAEKCAEQIMQSGQ